MFNGRLRHILYRFVSILMISAFLCPVFSVRSFALEKWADNVYVASEGACLMDADTGVVLYGKNEDTAYYPASITKVMTALLTIENCSNLSEQVTFSYDAVHIEEENSTIIGASEGDRLSVLDCLYSLLFQSANEVANALAEHVGAKHPELREEGMSDRDVFVKMMNTKAAELGCTGTHFNNPSGLTDADHYVTAHDMCRILAAAIQNDTFLDIESHTYWTHAPIRRYPDADDPWNTVYAKHAMLKRNSSQYYSGTIAGKTGYTMTAGNTLVTACRRNGMTLVTCVLNAHANHYNDTIRLMNFGFDNFSSLLVTDYDDTNSVISSDYRIAGVNMLDSKTLGIDPATRITIPSSGSYLEVQKQLITDEDGSGSARLVYTYGDRIVGSAELALMDIGDTTELVKAARTDPIMAEVLGIQRETESSADDGADNGETAADGGGEGTDTAGSSESADNAANADGAGNGSGARTEMTGGEGSAEAAAVSGAETAAAGGISEDGAAGAAASDSRSGGNIFIRLISSIMEASILVKLAAAVGLIIVILIILIIFNTIRDRKNARARARRRAERLRRTQDMTGTQQIYMDLEVQRRLRKNKRKRK